MTPTPLTAMSCQSIVFGITMRDFFQNSEAATGAKAWQRSLQRFFQLPTVEITIAVLVVASVVFTLIELS